MMNYVEVQSDLQVLMSVWVADMTYLLCWMLKRNSALHRPDDLSGFPHFYIRVPLPVCTSKSPFSCYMNPGNFAGRFFQLRS